MAVIAPTADIVQIEVSELRPGPWQPRRIFEDMALEELAASINTKGVLTPLRVVRSPEATGYLIVGGERRWRAACRVGLGTLPCVVLQQQGNDGDLWEAAILDNLHRANLRPGEEARAVSALARLGMTHREMALRLGKSHPWVGQRFAIARLPDRALDLLDQGKITGEEAHALTKLLDYPELVEACLEADGTRLKARLGGHLPEGLGERVQAVRRVLELERQRDEWASAMKSRGHQVLDEPPHEGMRHYARLLPASDMARAHQEARLTCEVWAWEHGRPARYCSDPVALNQALSSGREMGPVELMHQEEHRRVVAREAARDAMIGAWLSTSRGVEPAELAALARERIGSLTRLDDRLLARLGGWLGATGDRAEHIAVAERELAHCGERRLLQLWFSIELAHGTSHAVIPTWAAPWLDRLGFQDPEPTGPDAAAGQ